MITFEIDSTAIEEKFTAMAQRFENFPPQMEDELRAWRLEDLNSRRPETERSGNSVATTVKTSPRKSRFDRALARQQRRFMRRLVPKPVRALRRYARIGRKPARVLLPPPIRQLRRLRKLAKGVVAGRPRAIGRAIRPVGMLIRMQRRVILRVELMDALRDRFFGLGSRNLTWR